MKEQHDFAKEQSSSPIASPGRSNPTPPALQRFGNYDLVHRIGIGGMGEVYLARQRTAFGREVAVKIIRSDLMHDITIRKRFLREAEVNAYLKHDHILPLVEFGEEQGRLFLVTPYIKGGTLLKRLRGGALSLAETHTLFTALVEAVAYLHKRGVIHRDLKPSNIMLDHEEDSERVYVRLIDFGIASLQGQTVSAPLTTAGHEMGTEAYMAPERLEGIAAPSNDIYSLGIILYQMLTGKLPEDDTDTMLPEPLIEVVQQSTETDPSNRYSTAEELLKAFERAYQSLSLSHFRVTASHPDHSPIGRSSSPSTPHTPLSTPITPPFNEPWQPSATPATNRPAGASPNLSPASNSSNPLNTHNPRTPSNATPSRPISGPRTYTSQDNPQPNTTQQQNQNVLSATSRPPQSPYQARPHSEVILPPLPDKTGPFKNEDYEAPTSYINPNSPQAESTTSEPTNREAQKSTQLETRPKLKKRGAPIVTIISVIIIVIIFIIGSIAYSIYQSSDTATITITPRTQTLNTVFTTTTKLDPTRVLKSTQSASKSGNTTGQADCQIVLDPLPHLQCKQAVSQQDVNNLMFQLVPTVQSQVQKDLLQQGQAQGLTPVGDITYPPKTETGIANPTAIANPSVDTISNTVTVTLTLQGKQQFIKTDDVKTTAKQKLQAQLKPHYALIDKTIQIGKPIVQSIDAQGNALLKVPTAAVSHYTPDTTDIANHIAGKSKKEALAFLTQISDLDPNKISIRTTVGDNLPTNASQIIINTVDPSALPPAQLPPT